MSFGAAQAILLAESAHPFHPKALRASGGAVLSLPLRQGPTLGDLPEELPIIALSAQGPDIRTTAFPPAFGLLAGLVLGVGLVLGRDYLDNTIKDPEEIERYLHLDLLAAVPRYEAENDSLATEAYQNLRTALLFARGEEGGQVVLVTGTAPQDAQWTMGIGVPQ